MLVFYSPARLVVFNFLRLDFPCRITIIVISAFARRIGGVRQLHRPIGHLLNFARRKAPALPQIGLNLCRHARTHLPGQLNLIGKVNIAVHIR